MNNQPLFRKIIHIDMDCFYAAVEIRDNPHLQKKPVAVGSINRERGVVCTCNYVAREYGVRSAMPTWKALIKCPELILLPVNMLKYKAASYSIHQILKKYTEIIEPLSLDEAFLDVTNISIYQGSATLIAQAIRQDIFNELQLTASAGISFNKFLAKVASDWNKPNGQYVIKPASKDKFIEQLSINKIPGVGPVTARKLNNLGIITCSDLQKMDINFLTDTFGRYGNELYNLSRAIDNRPVRTYRPTKSVSVEETYEVDLNSTEQYIAEISNLYKKLLLRLNNYKSYIINKIFVKLKFNDFTRTTIERQFTKIEMNYFMLLLEECLTRKPNKQIFIRLIGIGIRFREETTSSQLKFEF